MPAPEGAIEYQRADVPVLSTMVKVLNGQFGPRPNRAFLWIQWPFQAHLLFSTSLESTACLPYKDRWNPYMGVQTRAAGSTYVGPSPHLNYNCINTQER